MRVIFSAILSILIQKPVLMLLACPLPFYCFGLVWSVFHSGGRSND